MNDDNSEAGPNTVDSQTEPQSWPPPPTVSVTTHREYYSPQFKSTTRVAYWLYAALAVGTLVDFMGLAHRYSGHPAQYMWIDSDLQAGLMFVGFLLLLVWTYRSYSNLLAFAATNLSTSPAMAVACHFIPLVGLIKPFLVYAEIAQATRTAEASADRISPGKSAAIPAVAVWWLTYIFGVVTGIVWATHNQPYFFSPTVVTINETLENFAVACVVSVITRQLHHYMTL